MIDHCPNCGINYQPFKINFDQEKKLTLCFSCNFDYRDHHSNQDIDKYALSFQQIADEVLYRGTGQYDVYIVDSQTWFTIARMWLRAIRSLLSKRTECINLFFEKLNIHLPDDLIITPLRFEYLNVYEREKLLSIVSQIMNLPLYQILDTAYHAGISRTSFWDNKIELPSILDNFRNDLRGYHKTQYPDKRKKVNSIGPKTRTQVNNKLLKLLRKNNYMLGSEK